MRWLTQHRVLVIAHRGASSYAPENTMAAFRLAAEQGADAIELDVQATADGHLLIMHDPEVDRTTDGTGELARLRLSEIRSLDAGRWYGPAFRRERVPLLEEVLEFARGRLLVDIELKVAGVETEVIRLIRRTGMDDSVLITSFLAHALEPCRSLVADIPIGLLHAGDALQEAQRVGAQVYLPSVEGLTPQLAAACRRAGLLVIPWTIRTEDQARAALQIGVDGIIANDPRLVRQVLSAPQA